MFKDEKIGQFYVLQKTKCPLNFPLFYDSISEVGYRDNKYYVDVMQVQVPNWYEISSISRRNHVVYCASGGRAGRGCERKMQDKHFLMKATIVSLSLNIWF